MQTINLTPGTTIDRAAKMLVANAPARADFNGIPIRARYATTRAADIVRHYEIRSDLRAYAYHHSPAGIAAALRDAADIAAKQDAIDSLVRGLPLLDFDNPAAVLAWVEAAADPADRVGVHYDHGRVADRFDAAGWPEGANCGDAFDGEDERNFAGWIVGQWLACRYPGVVRFVAQWRAKFRPEAP